MTGNLPRDVREALGWKHEPGWSHQISALSTTVFGGTRAEWIDFLTQPPAQRVDGWYELERTASGWKLRQGRESRWPEWIRRGWDISRGVLARLPEDSPASRWFERAELGGQPGLRLCSSLHLPGSCLVEQPLAVKGEPSPARLLWNTSIFTLLEETLGRLPSDADDTAFLGHIWPGIRLLWLQLLYDSRPRDHFTERIDLTVRWAYLHLLLLYEGGRDLKPNRSGKIWEDFLQGQFGCSRDFLPRAFPFWRLLQQVSFLHPNRAPEQARSIASIFVRDYLDARYLRLGIADLMPAPPVWLQSMPYIWKRPRKILCSRPRVGSFGIVDSEDLDAWKKVEKPFEQCGFRLIGQLGMGQFGRVYEAVNLGRSDLPERIALKVDRFRKGFKKEAIQAAEIIMEIGRDLAASPHVIRIFDAGTLKGVRSTYHVLQLVEGDTLDHLLGIAGEEHASFLRPHGHPRSEPEIKRDYLRALREGRGESWRKARQSPPFLYSPNLRQILDLLTSTILWIEEVHSLGYAINDLKNGNLMINRRGQFKAIDLDSYSRIHSPLDKLADFFFLGIATLHLITGKFTSLRPEKDASGEIERVRQALNLAWMDVPETREATPETLRKELSAFFAGYLGHCRSGHYARNPHDFSNSVNHFISLKRRIFSDALILD